MSRKPALYPTIQVAGHRWALQEEKEEMGSRMRLASYTYALTSTVTYAIILLTHAHTYVYKVGYFYKSKTRQMGPGCTTLANV